MNNKNRLSEFSSIYYKYIFVLLWLSSLFFLIKEVATTIIRSLLAIITNFYHLSNNDLSIIENTPVEAMISSPLMRSVLLDWENYIYSPNFATISNDILIFTICFTIFLLLLFIFVNSKSKILKNTIDIELSDIKAISDLLKKIRGLISFKKLIIRYNPTEPDSKSFSSFFKKYLILGNSSLKEDNNNFLFQIYHEHNHLKSNDSLFVSFFIGSFIVLYLLIPFFDMPRTTISFLAIFLFDSYIPLLINISKILIIFYFYRITKLTFIYFREFEADSYAYYNTKIIPKFLASSKYHPPADMRVNNLIIGNYFIDFIPLYFLIIFNLNFIPSHTNNLYAWLVVCLLYIVVLLDWRVFKKLYINKKQLFIIIFYHIIVLIEQFPVSTMKPELKIISNLFNIELNLDVISINKLLSIYSVNITLILLLFISIFLLRVNNGKISKNNN
jgi:hypothetical protein